MSYRLYEVAAPLTSVHLTPVKRWVFVKLAKSVLNDDVIEVPIFMRDYGQEGST